MPLPIYTDNARFLDTRRQGPGPHPHLHSNAVHQSASRWWVARKFWDGMRTGLPRHRMSQRASQPSRLLGPLVSARGCGTACLVSAAPRADALKRRSSRSRIA
jgi:hypothetical protein